MTTSPPGRTLSFPLVWRLNRQRDLVPSEAFEVTRESDEELVARLQGDDSSALDLLFDRYSRLIFSVAIRVLHDRGEAEDIVQEAFLCVYEKAKIFDPLRGTFKAWIIQLAYHRALDRKSYLTRRDFYLGRDIATVGEHLPGKTDLDREVAGKFDRVQLEKAFRELSDGQRRTLELFYYEGLEFWEISERLNQPLGNIRHHYYRALEKLRKSVFLQGLR